MAFPKTPLDVRTELMIGGVWTDITVDVYTRSPITITRGRADEASRVAPSKCSLVLNNRSGRYSPRNPTSPLYRLIGRNTPIRVSVPGPTPYLSLNETGEYVSTPDNSALDLTADMDLRADVSLDWTAPTEQILINKWSEIGDQRSYALTLYDGQLFLWWSPDGTADARQWASVLLPALPHRATLRATLDADNGSGGNTVRFYWGPSTAGPWTPIGDPSTAAGTTSILAGTAPLAISRSASIPPVGRIHAAEVRSSINGPVVASPNFTAQAPGSGTFTDTVGRVWSMQGGAGITNREVRFSGEVSSWPSRWDISGRDVWTPIEAAGILRRLGQGKTPLQSTLRHRVPSAKPLAYWPLEDGPSTTSAGSPIKGVSPMIVRGLDFDADSSLPGSAALPQLRAGASIRASVPGSSGAWHVEMVYRLDTAPTALNTIMEVYTGTHPWSRYTVRVRTDTVQVIGTNAEGDATTLLLNFPVGASVAGQWNRLQLRAQTEGPLVRITVQVIPISGIGSSWTGTFLGAHGRVMSINTAFGEDLDGMSLGHIAVFPEYYSLVYNYADHGYTGEGPLNRMRRLTDEAGSIPITLRDGDPDDPGEGLGPQRPDAFLTLMQEAEATDGGILYEARERLGLVFRNRATFYNQDPALVLDYTADGEVGPPLEPIDDDQATRNDITVTRAGGASARVVRDTGPMSVAAPPNGVGTYDDSITVSLADDDQCEQVAAWLVHLGTWDEARYPTVSLMLHAAPHLIGDVVRLDLGDRIQITNPPPWLPPAVIDLHAQGYTETLDLYTWDITLNCSPAGPWQVAATDTDARADTGGCTLDTALTTSTTSFAWTITDGPRWATSTGRLTTNPDFEGNTANWDGVGAALARVPTPGPAPFDGSWSLQITPSGVDSVVGAESTPAVAVTAGTVYRAHAWLRCIRGRTVRLTVNWYDAADVLLSTASFSASVLANTWTQISELVTAPPGATKASVGPSMQATPVPTDLLFADIVMLSTETSTAHELPFLVDVGGEHMLIRALTGTSPQTASSTRRAQNGVAKAHAAGTPVALARPSITAR
ncbi:carbohydrate binding domain-containing protein [Streptomyces sp. NPDC002073]